MCGAGEGWQGCVCVCVCVGGWVRGFVQRDGGASGNEGAWHGVDAGKQLGLTSVEDAWCLVCKVLLALRTDLAPLLAELWVAEAVPQHRDQAEVYEPRHRLQLPCIARTSYLASYEWLFVGIPEIARCTNTCPPRAMARTLHYL